MGKTFAYSASELANVEAALSIDRFRSYVSRAGNGRAALALYEWNSSVSAAFYVPLQSVEIGLRNAFHRELSRVFGATWHDNPSFLRLNPRFQQDVLEAKDQLVRFHLPLDTPHIVAELHFGFWTTMLSRRYEHALWVPALCAAFTPFRARHGRNPTRNEVANRFDYMRRFRNRIVHHEPIFYRDLRADYASLLEIAGWLHEDLAEWTDRFCDCPKLLSKGPPRAAVAVPAAWCGPLLGA